MLSCGSDDDMGILQFITASDSGSESEAVVFPLADDGYLYIAAPVNQSNGFGVYPKKLTDPYQGDKTNPQNVYVPDLVGGWKLARYHEVPFSTGNKGNNIFLTFCRELEEKYPDDIGNGIRLVFFAHSGGSLDLWLDGGQDWVQVEAIYDSFKVSGSFTNEYARRKTKIPYSV